LRGDSDVKLIVICSKRPTKKLLERVHASLVQKIEVVSPAVKYSVILDKEAETIVIVRMTIGDLQPLITCKVLLTSPAVRANEEPIDTTHAADENNADFLSKESCLASLAELRHAKWFQARASQVTNCVVIIRILRDLCRRNPTWTPLSQWALELLVEKSLSSSSTQTFSTGESLRRVLECVSSGLLLPNGPGLYDTCELEPTDAADVLTSQQREELTASAHMALRLLAFKQIYKILGIECLSQQTHFNNKTSLPKKRQHENDAEDEAAKKEKRDDEPPLAIDVSVESQEGVQESNEAMEISESK